MTEIDWQAQVEELLLLQRVAQRITALLDLEILLEEVVGDVAQTFGYSRSAVLLMETSTNELVIAAVRGWTGNYHRKGERFPVGTYGIVGHVALTGETYYAPDVSIDHYYEVSEPLTRSELDIPLKVRGRLIGVFDVQHTVVQAFSPARIQVLEALAGYLATAIENAQMFHREQQEKERLQTELAEAQSIQHALLPGHDTNRKGFSLSGICLPCRTVGGDWYDYIALPQERLGVIVADVAGKGMAAALLMSSTRSLVRLLAERIVNPGELLRQLNKILLQDFPRSKFVTMIYLLLDCKERTARLASAGHPPPLHISSGKSHFLRAASGLPLGLFDGEYSEQQIAMPPGSRLVLYSDGLLEAQNSNGEEYGLEKIERHMEQEGSSPQSLLSNIHHFTEGSPWEDDVTVVMINA